MIISNLIIEDLSKFLIVTTEVQFYEQLFPGMHLKKKKKTSWELSVDFHSVTVWCGGLFFFLPEFGQRGKQKAKEGRRT